MIRLRWLLTLTAAVAAAGFQRLPADDAAAGAEAAVVFVATGDTGFNHYLDTEQLQRALESLDGATLTDIALQLAEGERVLLRKHASGVTPQALLDVALKLAGAAQDAETLSRIGQAAGQLKLADLQQRAATLVDVAKATRSTEGAPAVEPTAATAAFDLLSQHLQLAAALGDRAAVEQIRDNASQQAELTQELRDQLGAAASAALAGLPAATPADAESPEQGLLRQLAAESRGSVLVDTTGKPITLPGGPPTNTGVLTYKVQFYNNSKFPLNVTVKQDGRDIIVFKPLAPKEKTRVYTVMLNPKIHSWPSLTVGSSGRAVMSFNKPDTTHLWTATVVDSLVKLNRSPR